MVCSASAVVLDEERLKNGPESASGFLKMIAWALALQARERALDAPKYQ